MLRLVLLVQFCIRLHSLVVRIAWVAELCLHVRHMLRVLVTLRATHVALQVLAHADHTSIITSR